MASVVKFRTNSAVADAYIVVVVNLAVMVHILILDVAGKHIAERLRRAVGYFFLALEKSDGFQSGNIADGTTCAHQIAVGSRFFSHILNLALVERYRGTDVELHLTEFVGVVGSGLKAPVIDTSLVHIRSAERLV